MPEYKLIYFDGQGIAEIIRLIFAAAKVPYEDVRMPMGKWSEMKPTTPMGGLPLLETDGITMFQSLAIARFLARKFGLAGKTEMEQAKVDMVVESFEDAMRPTIIFLEKDEKTQAEMRKIYVEETLPKYLTNLEKLLKSNNNGDGYFVGDSLTWADLHIFTLLVLLELPIGLPKPFKNYPKLEALVARVSILPGIAEWLAKRPQTSF